MDFSNYLSQAEVATYLNVSKETARYELKKANIQGFKHGHLRASLYKKSDIDALRETLISIPEQTTLIPNVVEQSADEVRSSLEARLKKYPELMDCEDIVKLGMYPNVNAVYMGRANKTAPPSFRCGRKILFAKGQVIDFILQGMEKCTNEDKP